MNFAKIFFVSLTLSFVIFGAENAPSNKRTLAIAVVSTGPEMDFEPEEMFVGKLVVDSSRLVFLRRSLMSNFEKMYDGETEVIRQAVAASKADSILLGRMKYSFHKSTLIENDVVCDLTFSYKVVDKNSDVTARGVLLEHGAGFSEADAAKTAINHLIQEFKLP